MNSNYIFISQDYNEAISVHKNTILNFYITGKKIKGISTYQVVLKIDEVGISTYSEIFVLSQSYVLEECRDLIYRISLLIDKGSHFINIDEILLRQDITLERKK